MRVCVKDGSVTAGWSYWIRWAGRDVSGGGSFWRFRTRENALTDHPPLRTRENALTDRPPLRTRYICGRFPTILVDEYQSTQGCPIDFQQTVPTQIQGLWPVKGVLDRRIKELKNAIKAVEARIVEEGRLRPTRNGPSELKYGEERSDLEHQLAEAKAAKQEAKVARDERYCEARGLEQEDMDYSDHHHSSRESRECSFCARVGRPSRKNRDLSSALTHRMLGLARLFGVPRHPAFDSQKDVVDVGRKLKAAELALDFVGARAPNDAKATRLFPKLARVDIVQRSQCKMWLSDSWRCMLSAYEARDRILELMQAELDKERTNYNVVKQLRLRIKPEMAHALAMADRLAMMAMGKFYVPGAGWKSQKCRAAEDFALSLHRDEQGSTIPDYPSFPHTSQLSDREEQVLSIRYAKRLIETKRSGGGGGGRGGGRGDLELGDIVDDLRVVWEGEDFWFYFSDPDDGDLPATDAGGRGRVDGRGDATGDLPATDAGGRGGRGGGRVDGRVAVTADAAGQGVRSRGNGGGSGQRPSHSHAYELRSSKIPRVQ